MPAAKGRTLSKHYCVRRPTRLGAENYKRFTPPRSSAPKGGSCAVRLRYSHSGLYVHTNRSLHFLTVTSSGEGQQAASSWRRPTLAAADFCAPTHHPAREYVP